MVGARSCAARSRSPIPCALSRPLPSAAMTPSSCWADSVTFLTRFEINAARRNAKSLLASPQRMHSAVMHAFTAAEHAADAGRTLWRVDRSGPHLWLYLLSPAEPDLTHLVEQAGWPSKPHWDTRSY